MKKAAKEKSHFVCSLSLIVLYNNKVNHTLCNALGYKPFTFLCKYVYIAKRHHEKTKKVDLILVII